MSGAWFVLLANGASSYVAFCEVSHVFSLIGLAQEVYGIRYACYAQALGVVDVGSLSVELS